MNEEVVMSDVIADEKAPVITMRKLLEAGVHFGHQTRRWNPKMKPYVYTARNGIYIIDLNKTVDAIQNAYDALKKIVDDGGKVLFVGTKKQCQEIVKEEALRSGSFYATNRWLGGTLTNFRTIQKRIKRLKDIEVMQEDGTFDALPKKEVALIKKEAEKLEKSLGGIKEMRKVPNALFVIDPRIEHNAVAEARRLGIPVFAIVDTNSDPDLADYVIPANDDATRAVKLIVTVMADAVVESKGGETVVAYVKDEDTTAVSMDDAIKNADQRAEEQRANARATYQARMNNRNNGRNRRHDNNKENNPAPKAETPVVETAPAVENTETNAE